MNDQLPMLDPSRLEILAQLGEKINKDVLGEVLELFLSTGPDRLRALREAAENTEVENVQLLVHSLKGSASNLGAIRLASIAAVFEREARDGNLRRCQEYLAQLETTYSLLEQELRKRLSESQNRPPQTEKELH